MNTYHGWLLSTPLSTSTTARSLFTGVRGSGILRTSHSSGCVDRQRSDRGAFDDVVRGPRLGDVCQPEAGRGVEPRELLGRSLPSPSHNECVQVRELRRVGLSY